MNICFVCNEYPPGIHGGIGTAIQTIARGLVREGHSVKVIGIYPKDDSEATFREDQGVQVWRMTRSTKNNFHFGWIIDRARLFSKIHQWANAGEIDLVELPDWQGWAAGWPKLAVPVVIRVNGSSSYFQSELGVPISKSSYYLERAALRRANCWCSVSRYAAQRTMDLFNLESNPDAILYNPVMITDDQPTFGKRHLDKVVFTGTLTSKKGVIPLIDAWPEVLAQFPNCKLDIYGKDGRTDNGASMRSFLQDRLPALLRDSVRFYGHVSRETLFTILSTARVAVFPSFAEAFALAPLEAMACGCPTVYSKLGSGNELIQDGINGLLINPHNPQDIARKIISVLKDDQMAERIGRLGREHVKQNFSLEKILPENLEFYQRAIVKFSQK